VGDRKRNETSKQSDPRASSEEPRVRIGFTRTADNALQKLSPKVRVGLLAKLKQLALNPNLAKPLQRELAGCYRVTYGRVRCVVRVADGIAVVIVIAVAPRAEGSSSDPYVLALEYIRSGDPTVHDILSAHIRSFTNEWTTSKTPESPSQDPAAKPEPIPVEVRRKRK
jgi:mRNA-degrading endonuclease RelE of RelBE toxin-antitoxin system